MQHEPLQGFEQATVTGLQAKLVAAGIACLHKTLAQHHKDWELTQAQRQWVSIVWQDYQFRLATAGFAFVGILPLLLMSEMRPAIGCSLFVAGVYALVVYMQYWNVTTWRRVGLEKQDDGTYAFAQNGGVQILPEIGAKIIDRVIAFDPDLRPMIERLGKDPLVSIVDDKTGEEEVVFVYEGDRIYWPI